MKFKMGLLLVINMCCMQLLQSMENLEQKKDNTCVLNVLIDHGTSWLDYNMVKFLAINKELKEKLHFTANNRKKLFEKTLLKNIDKKLLEKHGIWNQYGTSCGIATSIQRSNHRFVLEMQRFDLAKGLTFEYGSNVTENFDDFLPVEDWLSFIEPNYQKPFFNTEDDFCCYGRVGLLDSRYDTYLYKLPSYGYHQKITLNKLNVIKKQVAEKNQATFRKFLLFLGFVEGL